MTKAELKERRDKVVDLMDKCLDEVDSPLFVAALTVVFLDIELILVKTLARWLNSEGLKDTTIFDTD